MLPESDQLAVGFRLGLITREEVINWADERIRELSEPPIELLDLALMSQHHAQDILHKLGELFSERTPLEALPSALSCFIDRLREKPDLGPTVAKGLWDLAVEANYDVPDELTPMFSFDEDYWLATSGTYGEVSDVYQSLLSFCERIARAA